MIINMKTLTGYSIISLDGKTCKVVDFYFDDRQWKVRHVVADAGNWVANRQVVIPADAVLGAMNDSLQIVVNMTMNQILDCPPADSILPLLRQTLPMCWEGTECARDDLRGYEQLRDARDIMGFHIMATDGEVGHVEDILIDNEAWRISRLVAGAQTGRPGRKVMISPEWIDRIILHDSSIYCNKTLEAVKMSSQYTEASPAAS